MGEVLGKGWLAPAAKVESMPIRRLILVALAVVLAAPALPAAAATFSMRDVLSAPYVAGLTTSPAGDELLWKVHLRGTRNLYLYRAGATRKITAYDMDDGQDLDDIQFVPGLDAAAYMRGGTEDNSGGENINPLLSVPAPIRGIYLISLKGGDPLLVGQGRDAVVSPHGDAIAWIKGGALQIASLRRDGATLKAGEAVSLSVHGQISNPVWSPDGSRIAFTNQRNDHSYIGIFAPGGKNVVYATPDFSYDSYPAWSGDSTHIAYVRQSGAREDESPYLDPVRAPWSIWVADAATGSAKQIWTAHRGMGAQFYPTDSSAQLWWLNNIAVAFPWEGSGWLNLYAADSSGAPARALASGPFETETVVRSFDGGSLLYATNEGDQERRHIWQAGLGAQPQALTSGEEDQWSPVSLPAGRYAYVNAGYNTVPTVYLSGNPPVAVIGAPTPPEFPAADLVKPQLVTFHAADGLLIHGQIFVPNDGKAKHPALVFDHGGPVRQMLPGFHYMEAYTNLYESNQYFANHGFVVLSINYRSGIMYGHDFREAKHVGLRGGAEYQDVLAGARYLQKRADVDKNRLGIYGLSYGGYLTALALGRNSDIFKAGVDYAGVHNWATSVDLDMGQSVGSVGTPEQRKIAYDASPIASVATWTSPVFIEQGDDDRNVEFSQSVDLVARLRDKGVDVQTLVYPNETHEQQVWSHMVANYDAAAAFLIAQLKP
jgi:dipeptidyl aminopeptidase/acylaminoacyl peptidase